MKAILSAIVAIGMLAATPACAQQGGQPGTAPVEGKACDVPADLLAPVEAVLQIVANAVKIRKKLDVLVVGGGSSRIASPDGASIGYPARLEARLRERLPGVTVTVSTNIESKRTAEEVAELLPALIAERKPDVMIWQTGTVDAIRAIHPDDFRNALDDGVQAAKAAGTDVVLMNLQYSPRMDTLLATTPYLDNIRAVAQQQDVALFDRYSIMQSWDETGVFQLRNSSRTFELAKGVHACLGRELAELVIVAAGLAPPESKAQP